MFRENHNRMEIHVSHDLSGRVVSRTRESIGRPDEHPVRTAKIEMRFSDKRSVQ